VLLAKHAQHVVLIHFPIGLFLSGLIFDAIGEWKSDGRFATAAFLNFSAAAVSLPFVLATGVLAWYWALGAPHVKGLLLWHAVSATLASVAIGVVAAMRLRDEKSGSKQSSARFYVEGVAASLLALAAHLGGFLSGVNGP
jgi:uncharacterized membrane protein